MSRIEWNKAGERFFEDGVDRGVLYPRNGPGVPWNGLTAITESSVGGEIVPLYFDGVKYMDAMSYEDFTATLEAYSAPYEFAACDGTKQISPGLFATQQPRKMFGLCYRTLLGNDLMGQDYGYKLHLVYNITASPSDRKHNTIASTPDPEQRSWTLNTVPPSASTFRPTAHLVLDSTKMDANTLAQVEGVLYGRDGVDPYLPTVAEIIAILDTRIGELITATI